MQQVRVSGKLHRWFGLLLSFVLLLAPLSPISARLTYAAGSTPDPIAFASIDYALKGTEYVSNTVTLKNFTGPLTATVTGGTSTVLVKNNAVATNSVSVNPNDTLAIRTTSATADNVTTTVTVTVGTVTANWLVKTVPVPALAAVAGTNAGKTPGQFQVNNSGGASYAIPIVIAPGSGGLQPSLSLSYSNQGGNGILGVGWALNGLSTIARCPSTVPQDGSLDTIDFDGNDKFCLDGERLISISGTYGANGTEYRTERESFSRIISSGAVADAPASFKVWTKSGLIMDYGVTADSRIEAAGKTNVMFWAVNRISDTVGNYMTVTYSEDNPNTQFVVTRIDYTGNAAASLAPYASVQFTYANRTHVEPRYVEGSKIQSTKLLSNIKTYVDTGLVREYRLSYQADAATLREQLKSVQECGSDGVTCLPATTFGWGLLTQNNFNFNGAGSGNWTGSDGGMVNAFLGDYNGDGKTDMMKYNGADANNVGRWLMYFSNGTGFNAPVQWGGHAGGQANNIVADFNADGKADIAGFSGSAGVSGQWHVCLVNQAATGFTCSYWDGVDTGATVNTFLGDFDGDGRTDMMKYANTNDGHWRVKLSTGTSFTDAGLWVGHSGGPQNNFLGDYNGDGRMDIAGYASAGQWHVCLSTGSLAVNNGFACAYWNGHSGGPSNNVVADYNGDGKSDMAGYTGSNGQWHVCLSKGNGFDCSSTMWSGHSAGAANTRIGDYNGDGMADMAAYTGSNGQWHVTLSTGTNFNAPGSQMWTGNSAGILNNRTGDFNGDGKTDLIGYISGSTWNISAPGGVFPNLLGRITDGHGKVINITYKPITDNTVYTKYNGAVYARYDFQAPFYVVSSYNVSNGIGGTATYNYKYEGAEMNILGRGFRGFKVISMTDVQTGRVTKNTYELDFRHAGALLNSDTKLSNGTLIAQSTNTLGLVTSPSNTFYSFVQRNVSNEYEISGALIKTTTTNNTYDAYGNATQVVIDHGAGYTETNNNTYTNTVNTSSWLLGRLTQSTVTKAAPGQTTQTRTSAFTYDGATGLLNKEEVEPGHATLRQTKQYTRDAFGNITQTSMSGPNVSIRVSRVVYNPKGRFVNQYVNVLNQTDNYTYDALGNPLTITDKNGLVTTRTYDVFGRLIREVGPNGAPSQISYKLCGSCPTNSKYFIQTDTAGQPTNLVYYDLLDREIRTRTYLMNGSLTNKDTIYDSAGRIQKVSEPILEGTAPLYTTFSFDGKGRITTAVAPGNKTTAYSYSGLTTAVTDPKNQVTTTTYNVLGQAIQIKDAANNITTYTFDSFGNPNRVNLPGGGAVISAFDIVGNRTQLNDPNLGISNYTYNAFGELISQTDAKNQTTTFTYDGLSRQRTRVNTDGTVTWTYDTKPKAIGQVAQVTGPSGYVQDINYDGLGRAVESVQKIDGVSYSIYSTYDQFGRQDKLVYPSGFATKSVYNAQGYQTEVRNAVDNALFWQANAMDARGNLTQTTAGNGLITKNTYDPNAGWLTGIKTGTAAVDTSVQNLAFTYDPIGNLLTRQDIKKTLTESFTYDNLNRLISTKVGTSTPITLTYTPTGNIASKSDVGTYTYGAKLNAVTSIAGVLPSTYTYDANGNRLTSSAGSIVYNASNQPVTLKKGTTSTYTYQYAPDGAKTKSVLVDGGTTTTTFYVGSVYERSTVGTSTKDVHYVAAAGKLVAVYSKPTTGTANVKYVQTDHLGSPYVITNADQSVAENLSFDAWGNRRNALSWQAGTATSVVNRGYTGHEQLDKVGLVHMNGRVYDPVIGRFVSADPFVQAPGNIQSWNRYSYVMNNPLSMTDPTGYNWLSNAWHGVKDFVTDNWKPLVGIAIGAITGVGFGALGAWAFQGTAYVGLAMSVGTGAGFGFGSAFAGSILNGGSFGDALRSGLVSGVIGGVTAGVFNQAYSTYLQPCYAEDSFQMIAARAVNRGITGGLTNAAQGAKFGEGFLTGAVSTGLGFLPDSVYDMTGSFAADILTSAAVGGTVSELSGGKFANGAITSGFLRLSTVSGRMRAEQIKMSKGYDGNSLNAKGKSAGFRGDGFKLAGGRIDPNTDARSLLGGHQGKQGYIGNTPYYPGDAADYVAEAYAGPHDHLNSLFSYDTDPSSVNYGNIRPMSGFEQVISNALSWINVPIATPLMVSSVMMP